MRFTTHMCMPEGDGSREGYEDALEALKRDNRRVVAAMLADGQDVVDTVAELGLVYVPEQPSFDASGRPVMNLYGVADMVARGSFSCGDAAAYEAAVLEEKYGVPTRLVSAPQYDNQFHAVVVTAGGVIDPTANFLAGTRWTQPEIGLAQVERMACAIENGRVVCDEPSHCCVDERGVWHCDDVPGLTGRRENLGVVQRSANGQAWARTRSGAIVPVCVTARRKNPARSLLSRLFGRRP